MLTIIAALKDEIRLIKAEMEIDKAIEMKTFSVYSGKYQNGKINLIRSGIGRAASKEATTYAIQHLKPSVILDVGYAGGLDPRLQNGDLVLPSKIIDETNEKTWQTDASLVKKALAVAEATGIRNHGGTIVTVEKPLIDPHQKAYIGTRFEAAACDMESASIADLLTKTQIPFFVARTIMDPLDVALLDLPENSMAGGEIRIGKLMKHLKSNPKDLLRLPKFSYLANQARISLTNFIKEWIRNELATQNI